MHRETVLIAAALLSLLSHVTQAQQKPAIGSPPSVPPNDRGVYPGKPIAHPEALSGLWETANGNRGAVGIHLLLTTTIPGDAQTLNGVLQSWQGLDVGVYERKGDTIQFGEENYFSSSSGGGGVRFDGGRLRLQFVARVARDPSIDLDLGQNADGSWTGRFHRGDFDASVTLRRPSATGTVTMNPIVGTWLEDGEPIGSCVHIAQQTETEFTGWSDKLQALGSMPGADGLHRPPTTIERYGELMKVDVDGGTKISLELGAYNPVCCPHTFIGTLTQDSTALQGRWPAGPNQAPHDATWKKMPGDSCTSSKP